jgi:hypothetical protein
MLEIREFVWSSAPDVLIAPMRASRTVRARLLSGNNLPPSSSWSGTPSSSKNAIARRTGYARSTSRMTRRSPPQKSRSVTTRLVTLQREPPLTRILAPIVLAPSTHITRRGCDTARAQKTAAASPAAPPPTMTTSAVSVVRIQQSHHGYGRARGGIQDAI